MLQAHYGSPHIRYKTGSEAFLAILCGLEGSQLVVSPQPHRLTTALVSFSSAPLPSESPAEETALLRHVTAAKLDRKSR